MRKQLMTGILAVTLAVSGVVATGAVLQAQRGGGGLGAFGDGVEGGGGNGHGHGRGGFGGRPGFALLRGLDLTDQQRQQVRTIMDGHKSEFQQVRQRIRAAFEAQHAAASATPADEATIRAKASEVGAAQGDLAVLMTRVRTEVFQILTPEQQAKAQQLQQDRAQRHEALKQKMQELRQQRQQQAKPQQ
jgi:protein CpxP